MEERSLHTRNKPGSHIRMSAHQPHTSTHAQVINAMPLHVPCPAASSPCHHDTMLTMTRCNCTTPL
eukprot:15452417-Alexandrium_andersonii.AAC.1